MHSVGLMFFFCMYIVQMLDTTRDKQDSERGNNQQLHSQEWVDLSLVVGTSNCATVLLLPRALNYSTVTTVQKPQLISMSGTSQTPPPPRHVAQQERLLYFLFLPYFFLGTPERKKNGNVFTHVGRCRGGGGSVLHVVRELPQGCHRGGASCCTQPHRLDLHS